MVQQQPRAVCVAQRDSVEERRAPVGVQRVHLRPAEVKETVQAFKVTPGCGAVQSWRQQVQQVAAGGEGVREAGAGDTKLDNTGDPAS